MFNCSSPDAFRTPTVIDPSMGGLFLHGLCFLLATTTTTCLGGTVVGRGSEGGGWPFGRFHLPLEERETQVRKSIVGVG